MVPKQKADPAPALPRVVLVYAKAIVALAVGTVGTLTAWSVAIGTGPITRTGWIALAGAIVTPLATALGVAVTTNAED